MLVVEVVVAIPSDSYGDLSICLEFSDNDDFDRRRRAAWDKHRIVEDQVFFVFFSMFPPECYLFHFQNSLPNFY